MEADEAQKDWSMIECPGCRAQPGKKCFNYKGVLSLPHEKRVATAQSMRLKLTTGLLNALEKHLSQCRVCKIEVSFDQFCLAMARKEPIACSTACVNKDIVRRFGCCEKAEVIACVCAYAFSCVEHGEKHVGSHD